MEMHYHSQSDDHQKVNVQVTIQISYPMTPLLHSDEYFEEKREASSLIINALKRLEITDYQLRYCLVIDGELGEYTYGGDRLRSLYLTPGVPQWTELGQFIMQVTAQISKSISDNKSTLEITAALVNIIAPLTQAGFNVRRREKKW